MNLDLVVPLIISALLFVGLPWLWFSRARSKAEIAEDRPDSDYSVYTTEFDIVCSASELEGILDAPGVKRQEPKEAGEPDMALRYQATKAAAAACRKRLAIEQNSANFSNCSILLLIDQSGSVAPIMPLLFGEIFEATEMLAKQGASVCVCGFTTVGWKGGHSRKKWAADGRAEYPGRLCDLLHINYKAFGENWTLAADHPLLRKNVFFENVDGEALIWAADQLDLESTDQKLLISISDGVPADDSTLKENGTGFLWRDLKRRIAALESKPNFSLGSIQIGSGPENVFSNSESIADGERIGDAIVQMSNCLLRPAMVGVAKKAD